MTEIHLNFERPIDFLTYQLKQQFYDLSENELRLNHLTKLRKRNILDKNKIILKNEISQSKATSIKINLTLSANKENK